MARQEFNGIPNSYADNGFETASVAATQGVSETQPTNGADNSDYAPTEIDETGSQTEVADVFYDEARQLRPVVGWMVVIAGTSKGKDYHLHAGFNYIGNSQEMDISISDPKISRDGMVKVAYEQKSRTFAIAPCEGSKNISYCCGEPLYGPRKLNPYDRIEIGDTELMFVPLCGPEFMWGE
ncbi:MAG: FHA domain-containing protein [Eubacteriales bacterium]|nr:FHA domain-containing protein [Eubacteriales bacterium]